MCVADAWLHRRRRVDRQADRERKIGDPLELGNLHGLTLVEHFERALTEIVERTAVAENGRRQLDKVNVQFFHVLWRVDHHHVFDRRLL